MAHRGRRTELETAAKLLRSLELPLFVVPGNHDIPYTFPARFTRTFDEWERVFGRPNRSTSRITSSSSGSTRSGRGASREVRSTTTAWRWARSASRRARPMRCASSPCTTIWRAALACRAQAAAQSARRRSTCSRGSRRRLVIGGHVHQAGIAERREFKVLEEGRGARSSSRRLPPSVVRGRSARRRLAASTSTTRTPPRSRCEPSRGTAPVSCRSASGSSHDGRVSRRGAGSHRAEGTPRQAHGPSPHPGSPRLGHDRVHASGWSSDACRSARDDGGDHPRARRRRPLRRAVRGARAVRRVTSPRFRRRRARPGGAA